MKSFLSLDQSEVNNLEQAMSVNDFTQLNMPVRTSASGAWCDHKVYKKRFFVKPVSTWTIDNRNNHPPYFKGSPIMALFLGGIFKILMKGRAPDHYLVNGTFNRDHAMRVSIASMLLDNFATFKEIGINREYPRIENAKGLHRYLAATIILSNYDIGVGNFGLIQENGEERIAGIDLDVSLSDCFNSFQDYFDRLKYNAEFSAEMFVYDENIDLNEVHNKLKNKVNFQKLLDRLDKACGLIEENFNYVKSDLEKQESEFLSLSRSFFEKYRNRFNDIPFAFQDKPYVSCRYNEQKKVIEFIDGKSFTEKILGILKKHIEIIRKSSKTLSMVAEICENKTENCISLVDEYIKSHGEKDLQVGEVSHFIAWLEVNKKVSVDLIDQLKSKYGVSTTNLQNGSITNTQPTTNVPEISIPTPTQQKQPPSGTSLGGWTIGLALLFGAVGATLVVTGIIPEIAAIGVIATAVLLGIASAALGGAVGYLTDITVNKCCSKAAVQAA